MSARDEQSPANILPADPSLFDVSRPPDNSVSDQNPNNSDQVDLLKLSKSPLFMEPISTMNFASPPPHENEPPAEMSIKGDDNEHNKSDPHEGVEACAIKDNISDGMSSGAVSISNDVPMECPIQTGSVQEYPSSSRDMLKFSDLFFQKETARRPPTKARLQDNENMISSLQTYRTVPEPDEESLFVTLVGARKKRSGNTVFTETIASSHFPLHIDSVNAHPLAIDEWENVIQWHDEDIHPTKILRRPAKNGTPSSFFSIFELPSQAIETTKWEDDVYWDIDTNHQNSLPLNSRTPVLLDLNDFRMLYDSKSLIDALLKKGETISGPQALKLILKQQPYTNYHQHRKQRGILKRRASLFHVIPDCFDISKHSFNVSNDQYYETSKSRTGKIKQIAGKSVVQHSLPAYRLMAPFFRTHYTKSDMRHWHHPRLTMPLFVNHVFSPLKHSDHSSLVGDVMKSSRELNLHDNTDTRFVMVEYTEEYPPLVMNVGMATLIHNFYRKTQSRDLDVPRLQNGVTVPLEPTDLSPFDRFGDILPGQTVQGLVNNMFKAPIFPHHPPSHPTDFLAMRYKGKLYLREIPITFVVGQTYPLMEVPAPHSRKAVHYIRRRLHLFALRYFKKILEKGDAHPLTSAELVRAFPGQSDPAMRMNMRAIAQFHRVGISGYWTPKPNIQLPNETELRGLVTPEMDCAHESMLTAMQRLRDAGYTDTSGLIDAPVAIVPPTTGPKRPAQRTGNEDDADLLEGEEAEEEEVPDEASTAAANSTVATTGPATSAIDDEVKCAPWNTTHAFLAAMSGKIQLQVYGAGDPTGRGEGISMIRMPIRSSVISTELSPLERATIHFIYQHVRNGQIDLPFITPANAKRWLAKGGVPLHQLDAMTRWELVTRITELYHQGTILTSDDADAKRLNRANTMMQQSKFKQNLQWVWQHQMQSLQEREGMNEDYTNSNAIINDDDNECIFPEDSLLFANTNKLQTLQDPNVDALAEDIMRDLYGDDDDDENEEAKERERLELWLQQGSSSKDGNNDQSMMESLVSSPMGNENEDASSMTSMDTATHQQQQQDGKKHPIEGGKKVLRIERLMVWPNGERSWRSEVVKNADVIEAYLAAKRATHPELVETTTTTGGLTTTLTIGARGLTKKRGRRPKPVDPQLEAIKRAKPLTTQRCGVCGVVGHVKSSRLCPKYKDRQSANGKRHLMDLTQEGDLIKVEGTKISFSKTVLQKAEDHTRRLSTISSLSRIGSSDSASFSSLMAGKRHHGGSDAEDDSEYVTSMQQRENAIIARRRRGPDAWLAGILEQLWMHARDVPNSEPFHRPVLSRYAPDYHQIIKNPIDLGKIIDKARRYQYRRVGEFMDDVTLIKTNCVMYNGPLHALSLIAEEIVRVVETSKQEYMEEIEQVHALLIKEEEEGPLLTAKKVRRQPRAPTTSEGVSLSIAAAPDAASVGDSATTPIVDTDRIMAQDGVPQEEEHIDILGSDL